jgi:hypothetical protein
MEKRPKAFSSCLGRQRHLLLPLLPKRTLKDLAEQLGKKEKKKDSQIGISMH